MSIEDAFKNPENMGNFNEAQFEMLMAERRRERDQKRGLTAFLVIVGVVGAVIITAILAANGVFGG